jgi:hypothetical protein
MLGLRLRSPRAILLAVPLALGLAGVAAATPQGQGGSAARTVAPSEPGCVLDPAHGRIQHVVMLVFDNVHLTRDNPNVPSDLEQMPHLLNFIRNNGTTFDNHHTILISHTAGGILSWLTGLYPDRSGQTVSNSYDYFQNSGVPTFTSSFKYWTDPVSSTADDTLPNMVNADSGTPKMTPAPWVPFTRAGCDVGNVGSANATLENVSTAAGGDITKVFGQGSPEWNEANDPAQRVKAAADFEGMTIHCAQASPLCAGSSNPRPDLLPDEPGGYDGYQGLFGAKYVDPAITGGNAAVNDLNGNPITDAAGNPGFPGFDGMLATRSLGYTAQMLEAGVPVVYSYVSDAHDNHALARASGPGEQDYHDQLAAYDTAFGQFFDRLAADGITPANTLFMFTADEGDHFVGVPQSGCDGTTTFCTYTHAFWAPGQTFPSNQIGEVNANIQSLLPAGEPSYDIHFDSSPNFYVNGQPGRTDSSVRQLERDVASAQAIDPYVSTTTPINVAQQLVDPVGEQALHMVNADPKRTPTFTMFANPDFFLRIGNPSCGGPVCVDYHFAWNHGDTNSVIAHNWAGLVGPGVDRAHDVTAYSDHPDMRTTVLALLGLSDDYTDDGRVVTQALKKSALPAALAESRGNAVRLGTLDKAINAPFGQFAMDVLSISTAALSSGSASDDSVYTQKEQALADLTTRRDAVANDIRNALNGAEFGGIPIDKITAFRLAHEAKQILHDADQLAGS